MCVCVCVCVCVINFVLFHFFLAMARACTSTRGKQEVQSAIRDLDPIMESMAEEFVGAFFDMNGRTPGFE